MKTKRSWLAILLMASGLALAAPEPVPPARAAFRGELLKIGLLSQYKGPSIAVDSIPRFFLKLRIEGAATAPLEWKSGDVVVFAIHSWSTVFADEAKVGAAYDFSVIVGREDGKVRCRDLKVESPPKS